MQKAIMVIFPTLISFFCIFWAAGYYFMDRPVSAVIPGGYGIFSMASILLFFKTKHYGFFRFSQLLLMMSLPFLLQASLGGFRAGSAVQMWAMLAPIGALIFQSTTAAKWWFGIFVLFTIISGFSDSYLASHIAPLPQTAITIFFVFNFICAFFIIYVCIHYFVAENKRILTVINDQTEKLMEMDEIKNSFFANLSHEFRTPLALTIGPLEDAINGEFGELGERLRKQLNVMLRNSRRLLRLINQLLDISKIESGEMKLDINRSDIREMAEEIFQSFSPYAERKQITFTCETGEQPLNINLDQDKLERVFNNLLSNALKFTPDDGKVKLVLRETLGDQNGIRFSVFDTGPGIASEDLDRIFDRFFQVDGSSVREYEGTGIGLSLVKELVELHGGKLEVKSEAGFGTEFSVFIPGEVDHEQAMQTTPYAGTATVMELAGIDSGSTDFATISSDSNSTDKPIVLIVDDNADIRNYLITCLSSTYQVLQAGDGAEGLQSAQQHRPELIISDIMMPVMNGYQLCRAIREDAALNDIPVIFLTAKASEEMKIEGLEAGADDYISKPFSARELLARSRNLITLRQQKRELNSLNLQLEKQIKEQLGELVKNRRLTNYFSDKLLRRILSNEDATDLVTERRKITIVFCDLCNFTDMTDRIETENVTILLNEYLSESIALIEQHGGTVIQVIGDAIMAFFGAPDEMDNTEQANKAVALGIAWQDKIKQLSTGWMSRGIEYEGPARIGINQDHVTVGNFGSNNLIEYTAVGRGVNLAARLESSCTPGRIKVSHPVYMLTHDAFHYEDIQEEHFKGFARVLQVCELVPENN